MEALSHSAALNSDSAPAHEVFMKAVAAWGVLDAMAAICSSV